MSAIRIDSRPCSASLMNSCASRGWRLNPKKRVFWMVTSARRKTARSWWPPELRRMEAVMSAMDGINVISNEKLRQLSAINNTLYDILLPEEQKPLEEKVVHHVILKADIRDSTTLTRTLFERGLNPASYFSLNFYEPVNKLLPKYNASKVFIEGDAIILSIFEGEGEPGFGVGPACVMARDIMDVVRAY